MAQVVTNRLIKLSPWIALGLLAALLQGLIVFAFWGAPTPFLSITGLGCVLIPLGVELVVAVVAFQKLDEIHGQAVANPHSVLGQALRKDPSRAAAAPSAPPPTREAWKGGFEPMDSAADSMSRKDH
jgi:hypothetical protein